MPLQAWRAARYEALGWHQSATPLGEGLLIFRTVNPLGFLFEREGVGVEESSVVYSGV